MPLTFFALRKRLWIGVFLGLAACNFTPPPPATPTFTVLTDTPAPPTLTPSITPSITLTRPPIQLESPMPSPTPGTPTDLPTLAPTEGPFQHVVQSGETLIDILPQYGYFNLGPLQDILRINGMNSAEDLRAGQTLLIPRPTATPIPPGAVETQALLATLGVDEIGIAINAVRTCHTVAEGENMVIIADRYNMTLQQLASLNPLYNWSGCDYELPSGGPSCDPILNISDCVTVALPPPTATLSPTPSGSETPTATATHPAPQMVFPPNGAAVPGGILTLSWVSIGVLREDEYYFVEVLDNTLGVSFADVTLGTSLRLPETLIPTDGQPHTFQWRVSVALENTEGTFRIVGGIPPEWRTFTWQSR